MPADSLITPPNPSIDSFSKSRSNLAGSNARNGRVSPKGDAAQQGPSLMSPPVSPSFNHASPCHDAMDVDEGASPAQMIQDPVLFPADEEFPPASRDSLFPRGDLRASASRHASLRRDLAHPLGSYRPFKFQIMMGYLKGPNPWRMRELALLKEDDARRRESRLEMERRYKSTAAGAKDLASSVDALPRLLASELEPARKRIVAPRSDDKDIKNFAAIPDYCPDTKSLEGQTKCLKVDWKSHPIDLTNDPHRHLLHPDEITLASCLRLDCAHYLTVKRRFFVGRLNCLKDGKQFRKTDAQKACRIDVNKASQLWTAYERVGWLNSKWMDAFL
ncbi:SWIRM domain-containing protein [Escovopsis weberi]|uniref:SWIRM domain-containing protein n=1 Tax=Escovopsis weberi TaxID=150374 RepID=A0A0M8MVV4_ESCWE|nr:SWIRM domain-containing protein [Escovopsis weberi]